MISIKPIIKDPFFIFYDARSGSTYLANLLLKTADIAIPPESNFITSIITRYPKNSIETKRDLENVIEIISRDRKFSDWNIEINKIKKKFEKVLPISTRKFILTICTIYKNDHFPRSHIFGIKKGSYIRYYKKIRELFPESKFIGIIRDGRAVFNSKKHNLQSGTGKPFETNPYKAAKVWSDTLRTLKEIIKNYENDTLIIYYEKMILNTDQTIALVNKFLDVNHKSVDISKYKRYVIPNRYGNLHKNIEKDPLTSRINAWNEDLPSDEIFAFESVAYKELLSEGYELVNYFE